MRTFSPRTGDSSPAAPLVGLCGRRTFYSLADVDAALGELLTLLNGRLSTSSASTAARPRCSPSARVGALGGLVGEPNHGLEYMFAMMNHARLNVGLQGLAIAERAYQQALGYARERKQGRPVGWAGNDGAIVHHPDVRRMLMSMKARIEAMRGLLYVVAACHDIARAHPDSAARAAAERRVDLLTPIAKGWCTETGIEIASLGIQVYGGMGYDEETGAAQHWRDARITTIYEGTPGIQANDLVGR
jgi:3-(methylthio)propanoyl-CoA dehydrogenase